MEEIERSIAFRGGNPRIIDRNEIIRQLADALEAILYNNIQIQSSPRTVDQIYTSNEIFWRDALGKQHFPSLRVRLQGFHLTEWIPSAPGRYFTPKGLRSRKLAEQYYISERKEYTPDGKEFMIFGGVGSFRFGAIELSGKSYYLLGASSTGISHEGIPVAIEETKYHNMIQGIREYGGYFVTLVGTLQLLPSDLSPLQYDRNLPKYCLVIDKIENARRSLNGEVFTTVAITFQKYEDILDQSWTFCTFQPGSKNSGLNSAVNWLKSYINRYSELENPPILTDFDEHYQHFDAKFPLTDIKNGKVNLNLLRRYSRELHFNLNIEQFNMINAQHSFGFINQVSGNVSQNFGSQRNINQSGGHYAEGNIDNQSSTQSPKHRPQSPWASGSFYLFVLIVVIAALSVVGKILPIVALPTVIIGGIIALSVIGAFQLRHDEMLSEKNFLELMALSFKYLPWIRSRNKKPSQNPASSLSNAAPPDNTSE